MLGRMWGVVSLASTLDWGWPKVVAILVALLGTAVIREWVYAVANLPTPWIEIATLMASAVMVTIALAVAHRLLVAGPKAVVPAGGPTATTSGPNSPAASAYASGGQIIQIGASSTVNIALPGATKADNAKVEKLREQEEARVETEVSKEQKEQPEPSEQHKVRSERVMWLAGLASLRNVGVARRNEFATLRGDDVVIQAVAKYAAWLEFATKHIRTLPLHGPHEAHAFETLDRFLLDAAPVGDYANEEVRRLASAFSTHLERIEEIRRRYTLVWPV